MRIEKFENNKKKNNVMHELNNIKAACGEVYQARRSSYAVHLKQLENFGIRAFTYNSLIWRSMQQSWLIYRRLRLC